MLDITNTSHTAHNALVQARTLQTQLHGAGFQSSAASMLANADRAITSLQEVARAGMLVAHMRDALTLSTAAPKLRCASYAANGTDVVLYRDDLDEGGWVTVPMADLQANATPSHFFRLALRSALDDTPATAVDGLAAQAFADYLGAPDLPVAVTAIMTMARRNAVSTVEFPGISPKVVPTTDREIAELAEPIAGPCAVYVAMHNAAIVTAKGTIIALPALHATKEEMTQFGSRHGIPHQEVRKLLLALRATHRETCVIYL